MADIVQTEGFGRPGGPANAGELIAQGQTVQQIQTPYATAVSVQRPRELKVVLEKCLIEAEIGGDSMYYRWEVTSTDKKTGKSVKSAIEGPSVNMALMIARNMGNCAVIQRPMQETKTGFIFTAAFVDLETGFTIERQFRMDKNFTIYGNMDQFRKDDIRFQIGQSKAIRNVVNNAINSGILNKCLEMAKSSVRKTIEAEIKKVGGEIALVIDRVLKAFAKYSIQAEDIERKLGVKTINWDVDELVMLYGDLKALKEGTETADSLYGPDEPEPEKKPASEGTLDPAQMTNGDPATHQGYEKPKDGKKPAGQGSMGF